VAGIDVRQGAIIVPPLFRKTVDMGQEKYK